MLFAISCRPKTSSEEVTSLPAKDPRVETARQKAQDNLPTFINSFGSHGADFDYMFALKASFVEESTVEHMWSIPFSFDGEIFRCILNNEPQAVTNYMLGDTVNIKAADVEDFIIIMPDSTVVGDYLTVELGKQQ